MPQPPIEQFQSLLREMLHVSSSDLDFGVYRLMKQRSVVVQKLIDEHIPELAEEAIERFTTAKAQAATRKRADLEEKLVDLGVDFEASEEWRSLRDSTEAGVNVASVEETVYSDLLRFFRRYFEDGDFIPTRRYHEDTYSVSYQGEEVLVHWPTRGQHYVKTTEFHRDLSFVSKEGVRVTMRVVRTAVSDDNNKIPDEASRRFVLTAGDAIEVVGGEVVLRFEYVVVENASTQREINQTIAETVCASSDVIGIAPSLATVSESSPLILKWLNSFTARSSRDYFVHPRLATFLMRELQHFLNGEVVKVADLVDLNETVLAQLLARSSAVKQVAEVVITALGRQEEVLSAAYTKKKFVLQSDYLITTSELDESAMELALANSSQRKVWASELKIDESEVAAHEQLKFLALDTAYFSRAEKWELLGGLKKPLTETYRGLLINADNRQALALINKRFQERVRCTYIDPPFNTESSQFMYKDRYRTATWLTMMADRLATGYPLLTNDGTLFVHLDYNSHYYARFMLDELFGRDKLVSEIIWRIGWLSGYKTMPRKFIRNHETIYHYSKSSTYFFEKPRAYIDYQSFKLDEVDEHVKAIKTSWGIDQVDIATTKLVFKTADGYVYKNGLAAKEGRYPLEDTWNSSDFEELHSNKIKRNAAEYTPNGSDLTQKPEQLLQRIIDVASDPGDWILDYFAGSGTTPAVAFKMGRRFVAIEMGHYFDTDTLVRMKEVLQGRRIVGIKPSNDYMRGGVIEYLRLESYEDALTNLEFQGEAQPALRMEDADAERLKYVLEEAVRENEFATLRLSAGAFQRPFSYSIWSTSAGSAAEVAVDLPATLQYLVGADLVGVASTEGALVLHARVGDEDVVMIWRDTDLVDDDALDEIFKLHIEARRSEISRIYVNGSNGLQRLARNDEHWEVLRSEEEILRLMFERDTVDLK